MTAAMAKPIYRNLKQLGRAAALPQRPEDAVLERVPNPHPACSYLVRFTAPEFTSLCPITGQPDFAHLVIDYAPRRLLVESKSLKLFLGAFRNHGAFHEDCTRRDRQAPGRPAQAALAADRRLLVSARRHADRRVLADRPPAGGPVAAGPGCAALSRARLRFRSSRAAWTAASRAPYDPDEVGWTRAATHSYNCNYHQKRNQGGSVMTFVSRRTALGVLAAGAAMAFSVSAQAQQPIKIGSFLAVTGPALVPRRSRGEDAAALCRPGQQGGRRQRPQARARRSMTAPATPSRRRRSRGA